MKKIHEYISHYLAKHHDSEEKVKEFSEFVEEFFCHLEEENAEIKEDFVSELCEFVDEIEDDVIVEAASKLKCKDGTVVGPKWTLEDVHNIEKQYCVPEKLEALHKHYDKHGFWYFLNYVYAVHNNMNRTLNGYVDLAIDEITNKNFCLEGVAKKVIERMS